MEFYDILATVTKTAAQSSQFFAIVDLDLVYYLHTYSYILSFVRRLGSFHHDGLSDLAPKNILRRCAAKILSRHWIE